MNESETFECQAAYDKVMATIWDDDLFMSYPRSTHFISAKNTKHGEMVLEALAEGSSVALIYEDGHELLARNEDGHITVEERDPKGRPVAA